MKLISTLKPSQLEGFVATLNASVYGGNLTIFATGSVRRDKRWQVQFTIATRDSFAYGSRTAGSGRHMPKASWQAHRDLLELIFKHDPEAKLVSALAAYHGAEDFAAKFPATYYTNVGSQMSPAYIGVCEVPKGGDHDNRR